MTTSKKTGTTKKTPKKGKKFVNEIGAVVTKPKFQPIPMPMEVRKAIAEDLVKRMQAFMKASGYWEGTWQDHIVPLYMENKVGMQFTPRRSTRKYYNSPMKPLTYLYYVSEGYREHNISRELKMMKSRTAGSPIPFMIMSDKLYAFSTQAGKSYRINKGLKMSKWQSRTSDWFVHPVFVKNREVGQSYDVKIPIGYVYRKREYHREVNEEMKKLLKNLRMGDTESLRKYRAEQKQRRQENNEILKERQWDKAEERYQNFWVRSYLKKTEPNLKSTDPRYEMRAWDIQEKVFETGEMQRGMWKSDTQRYHEAVSAYLQKHMTEIMNEIKEEDEADRREDQRLRKQKGEDEKQHKTYVAKKMLYSIQHKDNWGVIPPKEGNHFLEHVMLEGYKYWQSKRIPISKHPIKKRAFFSYYKTKYSHWGGKQRLVITIKNKKAPNRLLVYFRM